MMLIEWILLAWLVSMLLAFVLFLWLAHDTKKRLKELFPPETTDGS